MANAKKCDRCGEFYLDNNKVAYGISYWNGFSWNDHKDLCPKCEGSLEKWYQRSKMEENEDG